MEKYDIISVVGEGSYGLVMRCRHRESGQYVAIKKFLETEDDPTVRKMALREIRMLKKLRHENLVNMIEVFRRKKRFFLVFEFLEHTVLEELEAKSGGLGYSVSRKYIYQVLRALEFIHSHDVIHRDIKPENVLVSRLGVIKLCDFGFARPYLENETLTDYVATRWYRSPELLVGDRYGKEVDIWAVGCLYSEMMTGEPLFPGESDIDQLFQIVRILGKLSPRHQILIMRNAMFRGMKQEQNTTLIQMFPNWNRDSIDFLIQCLKMDGNTRPDAEKVLIHDLFTRDNFLENFLSELRGKLSQEMQVNPLLKRIPSYGSSGRWNSKDDKKLIANDGHAAKYAALKKTNADDHKKDAKANEKLSKLNLSILSTQFKQSNSLTKSTPSNADLTNYGSSTVIMPINTVSTTSSNSDKSTGAGDLNHNNGDELYKVNYLSAKQRTSPLNLVEESSQQPQPDTMDTKVSKIIMINSLLFKDSIKFDRVRSAKLQKSAAAATTTAITSTMDNNKKNQMVANSSFLYGITSTSIHPFDLPFHASHAPMSLQSLQPDSTAFSSDSIISNHMKRLSPAINTTTTITTTTIITTTTTTTTTTSTTASTAATHFSSIYRSNHHTPLNSNDKTFLLNGQNVAAQSHRRHSNVLGAGDQIMLPKSNQFNKSTSTNQVTTNATRIGGQMVKRERNLIDSSLKPFTNAMLGPDAQTQNSGGSLMTKEPSPRILPPPQWLTGNLKLTSHGLDKSMQINGINGKRRITDWKSVGMTNNTTGMQKPNENGNELVLPNCPGATISPKKANNFNSKKKLSTFNNIYQDSSSFLITPRDFSAHANHMTET